MRCLVCTWISRWLLALCALFQFRDTAHGSNGRCLPDVIIAGDGNVVIYDVVASIPTKRLYLIGPHKKLWIVPETPPLQAKTLEFAHHFQPGERDDPLIGSSCTYKCRTELSNGSCARPATRSMDFIRDPIENVNVAVCALPSAVLDQLLQGLHVQVLVTLRERNSEAAITISDLPICVPPRVPPVMPMASLCCIIRNEARYLVEWIEYSRMIGIQHFFLYDHGSTDATSEVLAPYIAAGLVTWHNWSFPGYPQREAHFHCTHRYAHATRWLGLFDVDEFIVPVKSESINPILQHYSSEQVVLRLSAAMFGTSGHLERPPGLVIASYTLRNITTWLPHNPQHKVWFRPGEGYVLLPSIHAVDVAAESTTLVDLHELDAYYNHYRTKSVADHSDDPLRSRLPITEADEVEDRYVVDRFLPALQTRLYHSEGGRRPQALADPTLPAPLSGAPHGAAPAGALLGAVSSTLASSLRGGFEECPRLAHALAEELARDVPVVELACGSGYYTAQLRRLGFDAYGFDPEGSVAQLLAGHGILEGDPWEPMAVSVTPGQVWPPPCLH